MSAQIEARRLSGVDLGKTVTVPETFQRHGWTGRLLSVEHDRDGTTIQAGVEGDRRVRTLGPRDLIGIEGTKRTTTPTPKETNR